MCSTTEDLESRLSPISNTSRISTDVLEKSHSIRSGPTSIPKSPTLLRRTTRSASGNSFRTVDADNFKPNWHAGQEPGLDPSKPNGGRIDAAVPILQRECQITVVDYSETQIKLYELDNASLIKFLEKPQEDWVKCRWVNVNGLSWDVAQALAKNKHFHKLAIEDLMSTNNRTKADWYPDHTYIVMTLQKLIHRQTLEEKENELNPDDAGSRGGFLRNLFQSPSYEEAPDTADDFIRRHTEGNGPASDQNLKTIQRYFGGHNHERAAYMEKHSPLTKKKLAISAEQVSMFLTDDNTVIAFFEHSASDLETPILKRLSTPDTILRQSCDASMLLQALIDGIIDLAIPIVSSYQEIIGELELNVLTQPDIAHTSQLYVLTSEMSKVRGFVSPALNLINALKDHKGHTSVLQSNHHGDMRISSGVTISSMAQTYLGDVEDHIILITDGLDNMRHLSDNMIDLIFNTVSALQNESMKQLTIVTIIFLPLTFMTGYFGMNFKNFASIRNNESYFWIVATPVGVVVALFLMKDIIKWHLTRLVQRRLISKTRKGRLRREKNM